jgi:MFS family permease
MWVTRFGCRRVMVLAAVVVCVTLPLLSRVSTAPWLALALLVFGAAVGVLDCAMNIQAVMLERLTRRPMMSGFHGLFSLGGVVGAGGMSGLLSFGAHPWEASLVVATLLALLLGRVSPHFLPKESTLEERGGPLFARPRGVVLHIGVACFILFLVEGSVLDWSGVFLADVGGMASSVAGLGYAAFAAAMTIGRLTGDRLVCGAGAQTVVVAGAFLAALGLTATTFVAWWPVVLLGYAMVGAGCANIVPVLFSWAGQQREMPKSLAVPAITTMGYAGVLIGPAMIGFVAHGTNLTVAWLVLAAALLGVAMSARRWRPVV